MRIHYILSSFTLLLLAACSAPKSSQQSNTRPDFHRKTIEVVVDGRSISRHLHPYATLAVEATKEGIGEAETIIIFSRAGKRRHFSTGDIAAMLSRTFPDIPLQPGDVIEIKTRPRELRRSQDIPERAVRETNNHAPMRIVNGNGGVA